MNQTEPLLEPLFRWDKIEESVLRSRPHPGHARFRIRSGARGSQAGVIPSSAARRHRRKMPRRSFRFRGDRSTPPHSPAISPFRSSSNSPISSAKTIKTQCALSTGAPPARTPSTPASFCSFAQSLREIESEIDRLAGSLSRISPKNIAPLPLSAAPGCSKRFPQHSVFIAAGWLDAITAIANALDEIATPRPGSAIWRRRRHVSGSRRQAPQSRTLSAKSCNLRCPRNFLAQPSRSHRRSGYDARPAHRHARQNRPRHRPASANRNRRTFRTRGRRPRRLFHLARTNAIPSTVAVVLSAATRVPGARRLDAHAMVQEHERGLGGWHAEWETMPQLIGLCRRRAASPRRNAIPHLEIDSAKMRQNLEVTHGLIFAEAVQMALGGAHRAHWPLTSQSTKRASALKTKNGIFAICSPKIR